MSACSACASGSLISRASLSIEFCQRSVETPLETRPLVDIGCLFLNSEFTPQHCHLQCGSGNSLPTEQDHRRLTEFFFSGVMAHHSCPKGQVSDCLFTREAGPLFSG